jgi:hypothetical protein
MHKYFIKTLWRWLGFLRGIAMDYVGIAGGYQQSRCAHNWAQFWQPGMELANGQDAVRFRRLFLLFRLAVIVVGQKFTGIVQIFLSEKSDLFEFQK